jgi:hypothetical protein
MGGEWRGSRGRGRRVKGGGGDGIWTLEGAKRDGGKGRELAGGGARGGEGWKARGDRVRLGFGVPSGALDRQHMHGSDGLYGANPWEEWSCDLITCRVGLSCTSFVFLL